MSKKSNYSGFKASGGFTRSGGGNFANNYGNGYSRDNNPQNYEPKKHSGCNFQAEFFSKQTGAKVDKPIITAWNYSRGGGMISIIAGPRNNPDKRKTKSPHFENWAVKVTRKRDRTTSWTNGLYDLRTGKLTIPDMEMVANPKARNGGYFGTYVRRS